MVIFYVLVISCVVIVVGIMFNGKMDEKFGSDEIVVMKESLLYKEGKIYLIVCLEIIDMSVKDFLDEEKEFWIVKLLKVEKEVVVLLVKWNVFQFFETLVLLFGSIMVNMVFGIGVFGMGFSLIIILMFINGYVVCELFGKK